MWNRLKWAIKTKNNHSLIPGPWYDLFSNQHYKVECWQLALDCFSSNSFKQIEAFQSIPNPMIGTWNLSQKPYTLVPSISVKRGRTWRLFDDIFYIALLLFQVSLPRAGAHWSVCQDSPRPFQSSRHLVLQSQVSNSLSAAEGARGAAQHRGRVDPPVDDAAK